MRVAYFTNQYPKVSHSFIRREIMALEGHGVEVLRFAIRAAPEQLVDRVDREEFSKTTHLIAQSWLMVLGSFIACMVFSPRAFFRAFIVTMRVGWRSERGVVYHLIYLVEACLLKRLICDAKADHLHTHFGTNAATISMLCRILGGPGYSFTVHGPEEFDSPRQLSLALKAHYAEFVVGISSYTKSQLMRWCDPEDWHKLRVVRCGLESSYFPQKIDEISEEQRILCVGRLSEQKGQLLLLEAVARSIKINPRLKVILAGDGPMRGKIEAQIEKLGLTAAVKITGWLSGQKIIEEYKKSRIVVLPSLAEGLPVAIMEAFAFNRPVITTYIAGIPELVQNGVNGWLVPAGSITLLGKAIEEAIETESGVLLEMALAGRQKVEEHHNIYTETALLVGYISDSCAITARNG